MTRATTFCLLLLLACQENRTLPLKEAYLAPTLAPLECVPNLDGTIEAAEIKVNIGVPLRYLASPPGASRPVEISGATNPEGQRVWNLSIDYADDRLATLQASALSSHWFAASFPNGQWVAPLDLGQTLMGVYERDEAGLFLLGYASREEAPAGGKTLVLYTQPVAILRFPLESGKQWVSLGQVSNATVRGLPYFGKDTYQVRVEAVGRLELPDVTFTQTLAVRTTTTIEPAIGSSVVRRQVGWMFECFGEVARATAPDNELHDDFTTTAELRRLGL